MKLHTEKLFDSTYFQENLLKNHADFVVTNGNGENCETLFNDGWQGAYYPEYCDECLRYLEADYVGKLQHVQVPLSVELQGYSRPQYTNSQYPFDGYFQNYGGEITAPNPVMVYVKNFPCTVSEGEKVVVDFKGFETALFLYVNGQFVGYSENLYLDSEFDITEFLQQHNRMVAYVFKYSSSSWLLDQDFFRFHGIFRDVTLKKLPTCGIEDIELLQDVNLQNNSVRFRVVVSGNLQGCKLRLVLQRGNATVLETDYHGQELQLEDVQLWSAETPALYNLRLQVWQGASIVQSVSASIGFRKVEISNGIVLWNGKRIVFNGINRHEWSAERGRGITAAEMEGDMTLLKMHNINSVRTSHYPNNSYWYTLCDKYGLYMIDECCLETHGSWLSSTGWQLQNVVPGSLPQWKDICVSRILNMYERDKLHPAVALWSLGNESSAGEVPKAMAQALKQRYPQALVHYESFGGMEDYRNISDVRSDMYWKVADIDAYLRTNANKPYVLCEYSHAMGNSLGGLHKYGTLQEKYPNFQGGFIWDFCDQGLYDIKNGKKMLCYGGDFLDFPNDFTFCCNGVFTADKNASQPSPKAVAMKHYYQPIKFTVEQNKITLRNCNLFRSTKGMQFRLEILENGIKVHSEDFALEVLPGETATYVYNHNFAACDTIVRVTACDIVRTPQGEVHCEVAFDEQSFGVYTMQAPLETSQPVVMEGGYNIVVKSGRKTFTFSRNCIGRQVPAGLTSIEIDGEQFLSKPVVPTLYRPQTENDFGNRFGVLQGGGLCSAYSLYMVATAWDVTVSRGKDEVCIQYLYHICQNMGAIVVRYTVDSCGRLKVETEIQFLQNVPSLPLFGLRFSLPLGKGNFRYFANMEESYPDRNHGKHGICQSSAQKEYYSYIYPQECGNHMDARFVEILGDKANLKILCNDKYFAFKYLPWTEFEIDNATHREELPIPHDNYLTICGYVRGVGGDDSWGAPVHDEYTLPADKQYKFSFYIL